MKVLPIGVVDSDLLNNTITPEQLESFQNGLEMIEASIGAYRGAEAKLGKSWSMNTAGRGRGGRKVKFNRRCRSSPMKKNISLYDANETAKRLETKRLTFGSDMALSIHGGLQFPEVEPENTVLMEENGFPFQNSVSRFTIEPSSHFSLLQEAQTTEPFANMAMSHF